MLEPRNSRAALFAGVCLAVFGGVVPSYANTTMWGAHAIRPPGDIFIPEPARRFDRQKTKKTKPPKIEREARRPKPVTRTSREWKPVEATVTVTRTVTPAVAGPTEPSTPKPATVIETSKPKADRSAENNKHDKALKPAKGAIPAGPLHVIVSIEAQRASLYANGTLVASTKVSTGTPTHPTPLGVFSVIQKNRHHISNLYGAPMPYMQRLTWSGTALHAGPLPGYPASHGCIRLTDEFAQLLWKATKIGTRVIVTRDDVQPVEFAHAKLIVPKPAERPIETTGGLVRTADATATVASSDPAREPGTFESIAKDVVIPPPAPAPSLIDRKITPVSIFISRKDSRLYVRQAMQPLFDLPLTVREPNQPLGTHVFTAMEMKDGMRWTAVSVPSVFSEKVRVTERVGGKKHRVDTVKPVSFQGPDAAAALDRIDMPEDLADRLAGLITPGASLIVSDNAISHETGKHTDFIVLTP